MNDMTTGSAFRHIIKFSIPMLLGNVFQQMYNVVDSLIVGNYIGKSALAAVGASFPVMFVLISLIIGLTMGMSVVISQYYGAKDLKKVKNAIDSMLIFTIVAGITVGLVGYIFAEQIFTLMGFPCEVIAEAKVYFQIFIAGIIFTFGFNGVSAILRGLGDSKTPLYFLIIATVLNIGLDLLFVVGFGWGIAAVSLATVISQAVAFIGIIWYLNKTHKIVKINLLDLTFDRSIFIKSVRIGLPAGVQQSIVALSMTALTTIVGGFGTDTIAGFSIAIRLDGFAVMPAMTISIALTSFVGQNIGAGKHHRVREAYIAAMIISVSIAIIAGLLFIFGGRWLVGFFSPDVEVQEVAKQALLIMGGFYVFLSAMFMNTGVLRGAGDTLIPMFISIFTLWIVRIPAAYWLSRDWSGLGSDGIWWSSPSSWIIGFCLTLIYLKTGRWKRVKVISE
jgi:putative MATE family efflux protein